MNKNYKKTRYKKFVEKFLSKFLIALILLFLWARLFNKGSKYSLLGHGFFIVGFILLVVGWIDYLRLDGIKLMPKKNREDIEEKLWRDYDFDKEEVLEERDLQKIKIISSLSLSIIFILGSIIYTVLR